MRSIHTLFIVGMMLCIMISSVGLFVLPSEASTLSGNYRPENGSTIRGDYLFKTDDQGDSTRCELYIDGVLVGYMSKSSGGWDWELKVGTYAWSDGWHAVRFDSKGGATGDDSKSIYIKFDNNAPVVTDVQTLYPKGQTASKVGDVVTIVATVTETTSGIDSVVCDTTFISSIGTQVMYDDGNHFDELSGDGTYGTPLITITNKLIGYHPVYVNATDNAGNYNEYPGEVGIDTIDPNIEDVNVIYPKGQYSAKDGDQVRVTAYINDEDPNVDIVLDMDRSGSMGWTEENSWKLHNIDISGIADNSSQVQIRYSYETDFSWRFSGWNIDYLQLTSDENPSAFFTSTFENTAGNNNWVADIGSEWERAVIPLGMGGSGTMGGEGYPDPSSAYQGSRIMGVDVTIGNGNYNSGQGPYFITSPTINAAGNSNIHLTYYRWLNCDFPGTAPDWKKDTNSGDEHTIEVSNNGGSNWTTVWDNKQQKLWDGKDAAKILVSHQGANDRTALYSFGSNASTFQIEVTRNQDWSSNKSQLYASINNLLAYGATPLWDSITQAADYAGTSETLKALVVLTDGVDTGSSGRLNDAIRAVRDNEVPTFTIALGENTTENSLQAVANAYPGGSYYFAATSDQLDKIYSDISNAIENIRFPKGAIMTYVNATNLGGLSKVLMYDDGLHDDFLSGDNIYGSELITISTNGRTDKVPFEVNVEDVAGRTDVQGGIVLVDNSMIAITNSTVVYPDNKTNARDGEDIRIVADITDPQGVFPPMAPNGIAAVFVDAYNIGASSRVDMFDDGNHSDGSAKDGTFGSEAITITTGYAIGTFIVQIHAEDNASNTASQQLNVDIDNSGPTFCSLIWPIDNLTLEGTIKILASARDDAGIERVEFELGGNGVWENMTFNQGTGNYETYFDTRTLTDGGPYKIRVRAFDNSGDAPVFDGLSFGFFVDNTAPVLTIISPRNGEFVTGKYVLNVSYSDPGLFKPTVQYRIDDTEWLDMSPKSGTYWTAVWDTTIELEGVHTIHFRANDTIGNGIAYSVQVFIDNNPPVCTIVAPLDNEYVQGKYIFKVHAYDDVGIATVGITFMDENHSAIFNPQNGYYEYTIDTILIEEGARTLDALATDLMGRQTASDQVIFHIDNSAPRMTINSPVPGSYVSGTIFIDVTGSDVYLAITEYKIDGTKWVSTAIPCDTTKLQDGVHTIDIRTYDVLQHESTERILVTVDNHVPTIECYSPSYGQFIEGTFTFKLNAWDQIGIDNVELQLMNSTYFATLNTQTNYYEYTFSTRLYDDGIYNVKATVADLSGKTRSTETIEFRIDNNYPSLVLVSPLNGELITGELKIDVIADDTFLDSVEYRIDKGGFVDITTLWDSRTLSDGDHLITVRAVDGPGHVTELEFEIVVDNNPPELAFVVPKANTYYSMWMNVLISALDTVSIDKVTIRLDDSKEPIEIFKSPETGLYETSIDTATLLDGAHSIFADVYDKSGAVSGKKLEFYSDNTGPSIEVISPGAIGTGEILFQFNVTDLNGVKMVLLNIDSSGWREITLASLVKSALSDTYSYSYIWPTLPEDNGRHFYVVKAIDSFGNEKIVSREVEVQNIVKKVEKKPDYLGMINDILPLLIFITAIIVIILILLLFYRGVLHRWNTQGRERAERALSGRVEHREKVRKVEDVPEEETSPDGEKPKRPDRAQPVQMQVKKVKKKRPTKEKGDDEDISWD